MVSTSTSNPGIMNLFNIPKSIEDTINKVKNSGYSKIVSDRQYEERRASQKKAWNDTYDKNRTYSSPSQGGDSSSSTESSSGAEITDLNGAASEAGGGSGEGGTGEGGSSDGSDSGSGSESSQTSPLLEGTMTFEELVGEICNGIDLIFATKRSTVVITDYEGIYAEAKYLRDKHHNAVKGEDISLWQLEEGTYELDVSEYGFYNTVKVHYKNGTVTESYDDLVRVYGEVKIEYHEKGIDKTTAIMKAKAYLAAHVRDFDMSVKANILWDGDIDIGDIVTIDNPMTLRDDIKVKKEKKDPEYFFVMGKSVEWEGESPITGTLELRYGAKSPEQKEVPETGASYSGSSSPSPTGSSEDIKKAVDEVGKLAEKISYSSACQTHDCVKSKNTGDCHGMSDFIACELKSRGVETEIKEYAAIASNHRSVLYKDTNGQWTRFPYRSYSIDELFRDTDAVSGGHSVNSTC